MNRTWFDYISPINNRGTDLSGCEGYCHAKGDLFFMTDNALKILVEASNRFLSTLELEPLIRSAINLFFERIDHVVGMEIHLLGRNGRTLYQKTHRGLPAEWVGTGALRLGQGLAGSVAKTRKPLILAPLKADGPLPEKLFRREGWKGYAGFPLLAGNELVGVLGLYSDQDAPLRDADRIRSLEALCVLLASALRNSLRHDQASARARRFIALSRAITATRQLGTMDEVLEDLAKVLVQSFGFDQAWIGLVDPGSRQLVGRVGFGQKRQAWEVGQRLPMDEDAVHPALEALRRHEPVILSSLHELEPEALRETLMAAGIHSLGYLPIMSEDTAIGVLGVFFLDDQPFDDEDVKTLTSVAEQAAIAIENARLYERIRASEENYRTLFQSTGIGLVILNDALEIQQSNQAFQRLVGCPLSQLGGNGGFDRLLSPDRKASRDWARRLKAPPQSWETAFHPAKEPVRQVHFSTARIASTGEILVSMIDMTRERELERRLYRSEELASIGELSAGIAHEIRNPLVAITASASLLRDEPELSEEGQQLIDVIKEESDHLAVIVDDFLRFARPKKPCLHDENINKLMEELIRRTADIATKSIRFESTYTEGLPMIAVDRHQIQQVMTNLLLNGIDASQPDDLIRVCTSREDGLDGPRIRIDVIDQGEGIGADEITKIFQPFFSTKERGTGMGLAICRRIIEGHDGEIAVESAPNQGATFSVLLPIRCEHQIQTNQEDS